MSIRTSSRRRCSARTLLPLLIVAALATSLAFAGGVVSPDKAEFGGQDQSYAVAVSAVTGSEKKLTDNPETGLQGAALSPDGTTVLGTVGLGFGGNPKPKVVTVPFTGGREKVLVPGGYEPSWGG